jgi:hypothetical protein
VVVGVVAALAVAIIVVVALLAPRSSPAPISTPRQSGGSALVGPSVPQATQGVAVPSADGTSVAFSWTNPSPKAGDVYYWANAETPEDRQATHETEATVTGVVPGSRVCINVEVGRSGATGEPLAICTTG